MFVISGLLLPFLPLVIAYRARNPSIRIIINSVGTRFGGHAANFSLLGDNLISSEIAPQEYFISIDIDKLNHNFSQGEASK